MPKYWLFKSEPDEFSIEDLAHQPNHRCTWDGIRNYQARNFIRDEMGKNDLVLFYHSSCRVPAIVGTARVITAPYPDPGQFDNSSAYFDPKSSMEKPRWFALDIKLESRIDPPLSRTTLQSTPGLEEMVLFKQGRLSIQPVTAQEWQCIMGLSAA